MSNALKRLAMSSVVTDLQQEAHVKAEGVHAAAAEQAGAGTSAKAVPESRIISLEECKQHARDEDCWLIIHGKVHDVTAFLDEHPGGFDILVTSAGGGFLELST